MPYLSVFDSNFEKPLPYLKSAPSNLLCCKVSCKNKKKMLHLRPKISDFRILGLELDNIIVIFEISTLEFV